MKYKNNLDNDAVLAAAFTLAGEMEEESAENTENIEFSAEHEKKMQQLFEVEYKKHRQKQLRKYASRVAVLFVAAVLVAGVSIGSVEAWRVRVINFFRETTKEYTEIRFTEEPVGSYSVNGITLNYIPEGYRLVGDYSKIGEYTILEFQDDQNVIHFTCEEISSNTIGTFDTEDAEITEVYV